MGPGVGPVVRDGNDRVMFRLQWGEAGGAGRSDNHRGRSCRRGTSQTILFTVIGNGGERPLHKRALVGLRNCSRSELPRSRVTHRSEGLPIVLGDRGANNAS